MPKTMGENTVDRIDRVLQVLLQQARLAVAVPVGGSPGSPVASVQEDAFQVHHHHRAS